MRFANPCSESLKKRLQSFIIEPCCRLDDLGDALFLTGLEHAGQRFSEIGR